MIQVFVTALVYVFMVIYRVSMCQAHMHACTQAHMHCLGSKIFHPGVQLIGHH